MRLGRTGLFLFALTPPGCGSGLIEGAIGPQPHPSFIEVFCEAGVGDGYREMAGAAEGGEEVKDWSFDPFPARSTEVVAGLYSIVG